MNLHFAALYQSLIVEHDRAPRNWGILADATHQARRHSPLCGDTLTIYLRIPPVGTETGAETALIARIQAHGDGCALSRASASLLTEHVQGLSPAAAIALANRLRTVLTAPPDEEIADLASLGDLAALQGVRAFPSRRGCALLAWDALLAALG